MAPDSGKRLFHAIVVAGAALGGCGGGRVDDTRADASESGQDAQRADAAREDETDAGNDASAQPLDSAGNSPSDARDQDVRFPHIVM